MSMSIPASVIEPSPLVRRSSFFCDMEVVDFIFGKDRKIKDFFQKKLATQIAEALEVSLDYLTGKTDFLTDKAITKRITTLLELPELPEQDREHILFALDAMIRDAKARAAYK